MKYVIGSGWWCSDEIPEFQESGNFGDLMTRSVLFRDLWCHMIQKFTSPEKIIIVDSASPIVPVIKNNSPLYEWVSLNRNYGHPLDMPVGVKMTGFPRSFLLSMFYSLMCDAEYFVYVEQDCLLYGHDIIEKSIESMKANILLPHFKKHYQPVQCDFFIIKTNILPEFINMYMSLHMSDSEISVEAKIHRVAQYFDYEIFPFGCGRDRPIDWNREFFHFQHATKEEVEKYQEKINYSQENL